MNDQGEERAIQIINLDLVASHQQRGQEFQSLSECSLLSDDPIDVEHHDALVIEPTVHLLWIAHLNLQHL